MSYNYTVTKAVSLVFLVLALTAGCGSSPDDGDDDTTEVDGGNLPPDGNGCGNSATCPDANTTMTDAPTDVCAMYRTQVTQTACSCNLGDNSWNSCTLRFVVENGTCYAFCLEACQAMPTLEDFQDDGRFACTTTANHTQQCTCG